MNIKKNTPNNFFDMVREKLIKLGYTLISKGKVRDVYTKNGMIILITTDRISAFDVVSKQLIPYKGQVLNMLAAYNMQKIDDAGICPVALVSVPNQNTTIQIATKPFKIEVIRRGYLAGSASKKYMAGARSMCGVNLPNGMRENEQFGIPISTPTTKAEAGHDEDISQSEIIESGLATLEQYQQIDEYAKDLFEKGTAIARKRGLILVDTKYEFGLSEGNEIYLIDEVHTPDSSRFWISSEYEANFSAGKPQNQLSKEFLREWLTKHNFSGKKGTEFPAMPLKLISEVSHKYVDLYERITGEKFTPQTLAVDQFVESIEESIKK